MLYRQTIVQLPGAACDEARAAIAQDLDAAAAILEDLKAEVEAAPPPYLLLPSRRDDLTDLTVLAERIAARARDVVVLGTGGSSLGAQALAALTGPDLSRDPERLRLHFPDNLGAYGMDRLLGELDLARSHFVAVSKSGGTAETVAQLITSVAAVRQAVPDGELADRVTVITQPQDSVMRRFAGRWGLPVFDHDPNLGGRYSVLSLVGLLPAMLAGLDATAVREGADQVLRQALSGAAVGEVAPAVGAATAHALARTRGINVNVVMPYESRLARFAAWYQQLWAESIGKDGVGTTPVAALGPVDQHSQLQLYLDGPDDKFYTVLTQDTSGQGPVADPVLADDPAVAYLAGRTIGDLVTAEGAASVEALVRRGRPVRHIRLSAIDEATVGALMMHFMLETVIACRLAGVDPFDQPAVEEGKVLTRDLLGQAGGVADTRGAVLSEAAV